MRLVATEYLSLDGFFHEPGPLLFSERMTFSAGWGFYWRENINDGLYGIPGNLIVPSNGVKSRYEGSRPIVELDWQITGHLSAT